MLEFSILTWGIHYEKAKQCKIFVSGVINPATGRVPTRNGHNYRVRIPFVLLPLRKLDPIYALYICSSEFKW